MTGDFPAFGADTLVRIPFGCRTACKPGGTGFAIGIAFGCATCLVCCGINAITIAIDNLAGARAFIYWLLFGAVCLVFGAAQALFGVAPCAFGIVACGSACAVILRIDAGVVRIVTLGK